MELYIIIGLIIITVLDIIAVKWLLRKFSEQETTNHMLEGEQKHFHEALLSLQKEFTEYQVSMERKLDNVVKTHTKEINHLDRKTNKINSELNDNFTSLLNPYSIEISDSTEPLIDEIIFGCIDVNANNFVTNANTDDGSCDYNFNIGLQIVEQGESLNFYPKFIDGGLSTNESETITNDKGEEIVVEGEFFYEFDILDGENVNQINSIDLLGDSSLRPRLFVKFEIQGQAPENLIVLDGESRSGFRLQQIIVISGDVDMPGSFRYGWYSIDMTIEPGPENFGDGDLLFKLGTSIELTEDDIVLDEDIDTDDSTQTTTETESEPNLLIGTVEKRPLRVGGLRIISLSGTIQENLPVDTIVAGMNITLSTTEFSETLVVTDPQPNAFQFNVIGQNGTLEGSNFIDVPAGTVLDYEIDLDEDIVEINTNIQIENP